MARRYEPSLTVRVAGADMGPANASQQLAETLRGFTRMGGGMLRERQLRRGAEAGAAAPVGADGKPTLRKPFSAFNRSYNDAALRGYLIEQYTDAEAQLARIEGEAGNDPEKFRTLADGARKGSVSGAVGQAKGDVNEIWQRGITSRIGGITARQTAERRAYNKAILQDGLETVGASISRKLTSGDPELMLQAQEEEVQYQLMIDGAVASKDLTEAEGVVLRSTAAKKLTQELVFGAFEREMRTGDPVAFIGKVMSQPVENLNDDEKQQTVAGMFQRLNRYEALLSEGNQLATAEQKGRWAAGERDATVRALRRDITNVDLARMVENDELDPAVGRTLSNEISSPTRANDDEALKFKVETNLLTYSEADIAGMGGLSHKTRSDLILKRREEAEGWRNDQGAQEALRRIDVELGIPSGLGPQFQIAITEEKATAAANARSYFYDLVEATPEEERKAKYFELADQAITQMRTGLTQTDLAKARTSLQQFQGAVKNPADMNERERREYDETVKRYTDQINRLESSLGGD